MADIVYINEEEGKKRVMNNGKLYAKLLAKFKTDINLNDLTAFVDAQDWEKAQGAVHTIKGTAANLAFTELSSRALDVETQIKARSLNSESMENLKVCFNNTLIHIEGVIEKYV